MGNPIAQFVPVTGIAETIYGITYKDSKFGYDVDPG
jgi:hypothetical protein